MRSIWSQEKYLAAWRFVAEAHAGQQIIGTQHPYIVHLGRVAMEVMASMARGTLVDDPDLAVQCALLHDVIEDTRVTYDEVVGQFGRAVADGVLALSKDKQLPSKAAQMADSLRRIQAQPKEVWMVKLADRISNLQPPPAQWTSERVASYRQEADQILEVLGEADPYLAVRLRAKIDAYPRN